MARHFGPQHIKNGYAAMAAIWARPRHKGASNRSVAEAIAAARRTAARMAAASSKKK